MVCCPSVSDGAPVLEDVASSDAEVVIVADIVAGFNDASRVVVQRDRAAAIAQALATAGPDDVILVAGKGHEPYQDIAGIRHAFDDTAVARDLLRRRAQEIAP